MPEELEAEWKPFYLAASEKGRSRALYEQIFREDSRRFVDYYYQYKTRDNRILALEEDGRLIAMLHRNPYTMIVNGSAVRADYIVAVATEKEHRHQGCMRALLMRALSDMAAERMPFTFLMPASESIYAPFDFVWICPRTRLPERVLRLPADAQNRYLAARFQMFVRRDARYMENMAAERLSEEGEAPEEGSPVYMARITEVCGMLSMTYSSRPQTLYMKVKDPILPQNDGFFRWTSGPEESHAEKLSEEPERVDLELTVGELTSMIFGALRICLSEWV